MISSPLIAGLVLVLSTGRGLLVVAGAVCSAAAGDVGAAGLTVLKGLAVLPNPCFPPGCCVVELLCSFGLADGAFELGWALLVLISSAVGAVVAGVLDEAREPFFSGCAVVATDL